MIIDFHTHNFPDSIAPRAIATMVEMLRHQFVPFGDGTLSCQLADARENGIDRCVMCPIATKPSQADVILRTALEIRDGARGEEAARVIIPLASVHPADPDFKAHFDTYAKKLKLRSGQTLHFELGRAIVAQCGSLITRTLYIKEGYVKKFCIVDAGFTDLIRPALYQAYHKIENLSSDEPVETYDVVGPICESTDVFAKQIDLNKAHRGDFLAIRSAGAYGEIMASQYNSRQLPVGYTSEEV